MSDRIERLSFHKISNPYPPSWIDRFVSWIDTLPGSAWLFYVVSLLAFGLLINAVFWIDGSLPFGSIEPLNTSFAFFIIYSIWLYKHLTKVGAQALKKYLPLLDFDDNEVSQTDYRLAILPRWQGRLIVLFSIVFSILNIVAESDPYGDVVPNTALPYIFDVVISSFMNAILFSLLIRSFRQLGMVRRLHSQATTINLLNLEPAHAFSLLSSRTGIGITMLLAISSLVPSSFDTNMKIFSAIFIMVIAITIFLLPIIGIRDNLEEEKGRALESINNLLQTTIANFHHKVEIGEYQDVPAMKETINTLILELEFFTKISTWPWDLRTLRSFASSMLLPIFLLIISQLVEKVF